MARYTGPKCRLCRRAGVKLNLKGTRCDTEKCGLARRAQAPGQHGNMRRRRRISEYGLQLGEKQKAKRIYGILERQFKKYVKDAMAAKEVTGEALLHKLESRLDNLVYRSGFAVSRSQARQLIRSGFFMVNDTVETVPSRQLREKDVIKPVSFDKIHLREGFILPEWLKANVKERQVELVRLPTLEDTNEPFDVQLIIEFYSR